MGRMQFATIRSEHASKWLRWACDSLHPPERVWPATAKKFRQMFKLLLSYQRLDTVGYVPASLRAGGATDLFTHGLDPHRIKFYGRWASEKALMHYLQESVTYQLAHTAPRKAQLLVAYVLKHGSNLLEIPQEKLSSLFRRPASSTTISALSGWDGQALAPCPDLRLDTRWEAFYPKP